MLWNCSCRPCGKHRYGCSLPSEEYQLHIAWALKSFSWSCFYFECMLFALLKFTQESKTEASPSPIDSDVTTGKNIKKYVSHFSVLTYI